MSLKQIVDNAQSQPGIVKECGELVWMRDGNFVVYDRKKGDFVKCGGINISDNFNNLAMGIFYFFNRIIKQIFIVGFEMD